MGLLISMIAREKIRNKKMITEYTKELELLPKGTIKPKTVNGKVYFYLCYREGQKVVTKYIGKDEESISFIRDQLIRRSQIEEILKKLKIEKMKIEKLEAML